MIYTRIDNQSNYNVIPSEVNEIISDNYFSGIEKLRGYLLRLKAYYDEKEKNYIDKTRLIEQRLLGWGKVTIAFSGSGAEWLVRSCR